MIPRQLRLKGISSAFPDEVTVDFEALGPGLVAVVGDNRAGKTHLIESCAAALYREFPSYGESIAEHVAPGCRDAFVEFTFALGAHEYRSLVQIDPLFGGGRGKQEAYLIQDGVPLAGPLVREFDQAILQILPPRELFLASVFACQNGAGSFFQLAKSARKDLFTAMLGVAHLQTKAEAAASRASALLAALERVRTELAGASGYAERARALDAERATLAPLITAARAAVDDARQTDAAAAAALATARTTLADARAQAETVDRDRLRLTNERDAAHQRIGALTAKREQLDGLLADEATIAVAVAALPELDARIAALLERERVVTAEQGPLATTHATRTAERQQLLADAERAQRELTTAIGARERAAAATIDIEATAWRAALAATDAALGTCVAEAGARARAAEAERTAVEHRARLVARRDDLAPRTTLLARIPNVPECAACPLTADARAAEATLATLDRELAALPLIDGTPAQDAYRTHGTTRAELEQRRDDSRRSIAEAAPALAQLDADRALAATVATRQGAFDALVARGKAVRAELDRVAAELATRTTECEQIAAERRILDARRREVAADAGRAPTIAAARAQRDETQVALEAARQAVEGVTSALAALPTIDVQAPAAAAEAAEREADAAATALRAADAALAERRQDDARLEGERTALGDPAATVARLRADEAALVTDAADWTALARALGRDGVQALELDAAGPSVTAIANDLLAACYGTRFQLAIETTTPKKAGGAKEVFNIRILDSDAGLELTKDSGGGMVILDEALRLALAIFNRQRAGFALQTLWRDETAGALSPENADRYVAMLRRALEIGDFHQLFFISHATEVWQQADAQLFVGRGRVVTEAAAA